MQKIPVILYKHGEGLEREALSECHYDLSLREGTRILTKLQEWNVGFIMLLALLLSTQPVR